MESGRGKLSVRFHVKVCTNMDTCACKKLRHESINLSYDLPHGRRVEVDNHMF